MSNNQEETKLFAYLEELKNEGAAEQTIENKMELIFSNEFDLAHTCIPSVLKLIADGKNREATMELLEIKAKMLENYIKALESLGVQISMPVSAEASGARALAQEMKNEERYLRKLFVGYKWEDGSSTGNKTYEELDAELNKIMNK